VPGDGMALGSCGGDVAVQRTPAPTTVPGSEPLAGNEALDPPGDAGRMRVRVAGVSPVSQAEQAVEGIQGMLDRS
jgi:hypothetical protein